MSTETASPELHWERLKSEMEQNGPEGVIAFIESMEDEKERLDLYFFSHQAFNNREWNSRDWKGKNFDDYVAVTNAAINEALRQSEKAGDPETARKLLDTANIMSFNFAANLAECWPGDDMPRERRHFEEGLRVASNCVTWREQLGKPPDRKSMAYWVKGMHALSLRDYEASMEAFRRSLEYAREGASAAGKTPEIVAGSTFDVILNNGYLGIAEIATGIDSGRNRYETTRQAFQEQMQSDNKEIKEDAAFGLAQLKKVEEKFAV